MNQTNEKYKPNPETFKQINDAFFKAGMSVSELSRKLGRSKNALQKELSGNVPLYRGGQRLLAELRFLNNE